MGDKATAKRARSGAADSEQAGYTVRLVVRVPRTLATWVGEQAQLEGLSQSAWLRHELHAKRRETLAAGE